MLTGCGAVRRQPGRDRRSGWKGRRRARSTSRSRTARSRRRASGSTSRPARRSRCTSRPTPTRRSTSTPIPSTSTRSAAGDDVSETFTLDDARAGRGRGPPPRRHDRAARRPSVIAGRPAGARARRVDRPADPVPLRDGRRLVGADDLVRGARAGVEGAAVRERARAGGAAAAPPVARRRRPAAHGLGPRRAVRRPVRRRQRRARRVLHLRVGRPGAAGARRRARVARPLAVAHDPVAGRPRPLDVPASGSATGRRSLGLLAFVWLELASPDPGSVHAVRAWVAVLRDRDARRRHRVRSAVVRPGRPVRRLQRDRRPALAVRPRRPLGACTTRCATCRRCRSTPGLVAVLAVLLGSTAYDSFSASSFWQCRTLSGWQHSLTLLGFCVVVARAVRRWRRARPGESPAPNAARCPGRLAHSLVPIVVGYIFAHYLTYLLEKGQAAFFALLDPLGRGWTPLGDPATHVLPVRAHLDARGAQGDVRRGRARARGHRRPRQGAGAAAARRTGSAGSSRCCC